MWSPPFISPSPTSPPLTYLPSPSPISPPLTYLPSPHLPPLPSPTSPPLTYLPSPHLPPLPSPTSPPLTYLPSPHLSPLSLTYLSLTYLYLDLLFWDDGPGMSVHSALSKQAHIIIDCFIGQIELFIYSDFAALIAQIELLQLDRSSSSHPIHYATSPGLV